MHPTLDEATVAYLSHDKRYKGLYLDHATISYLILPTEANSWKTPFEIDDDYMSPPFYGSSGSSTSISLNSLSLREEHQKRFAHAMRVLHLKPSVHPSQLHCHKPASSSNGSHDREQSDPFQSKTRSHSVDKTKKKYSKLRKQIKKVEQGKWPRLMLLVKETIVFDG